MKITLPQNRWYGEEPVTIELPDSWDTYVAEMPGDSLPVLNYEEIRDKINSPVGSERISKIAGGKKSACILFDDMSRGTPCREAAHAVLAELSEAGIKKENIIFICATGNHGALEYDDFRKKLGDEIVEEYFVFNHNPYENLVDVGTTSRGHRVLINAEVMKYEVRIGIGGICPHPAAGFSGGCKIILPGVSGIDTAAQNHAHSFGGGAGSASFSDGEGNLQRSDMREDIEEAGMLAGLDFKIDLLINSSCGIVDVYAGHPIKEYYRAVRKAFEVYGIGHFKKADVVIANANAKSNEAFLASAMAGDCINPGGDIVMVNFNRTGPVNHYLLNGWGRTTGGRQWKGSAEGRMLPGGARKLILYNPWPTPAAVHGFYGGTSGKNLFFAKTWEEVMEHLSDRGEGTRAAVIKEALMSFFADDFKLDYTPVNLNLKKQESQ